MYILLNNNTVSEIIPDINPAFPDVLIEDRYAPDFVAKLMHVSDDTEVHQNDVYDAETGTFAPPVPEEPQEETVVLTETEIHVAYKEGVESA